MIFLNSRLSRVQSSRGYHKMNLYRLYLVAAVYWLRIAIPNTLAEVTIEQADLYSFPLEHRLLGLAAHVV